MRRARTRGSAHRADRGGARIADEHAQAVNAVPSRELGVLAGPESPGIVPGAGDDRCSAGRSYGGCVRGAVR